MPSAAKGETPRSLALLYKLARSILIVFLAWLPEVIQQSVSSPEHSSDDDGWGVGGAGERVEGFFLQTSTVQIIKKTSCWLKPLRWSPVITGNRCCAAGKARAEGSECLQGKHCTGILGAACSFEDSSVVLIHVRPSEPTVHMQRQYLNFIVS